MCVCVCVRERERERKRKKEKERERERERRREGLQFDVPKRGVHEPLCVSQSSPSQMIRPAAASEPNSPNDPAMAKERKREK